MPIRDINIGSSKIRDEYRGAAEGKGSTPEVAQQTESRIDKAGLEERLNQQFLRSRSSIGSTFMQQQLSSRLAESVGTDETSADMEASTEDVSLEEPEAAQQEQSDLNDVLNQLAEILRAILGGGYKPMPEPAPE